MPTNAPIVLPLDGSKNAENAIPYAVFLANAYAAPLHLVHILSEDEHRGPVDPDTASGQFKSYATDLMKGYTVTGGVEAALLEGNPAKRVLDYASDARGIVLASHGRSGVKATLIGSVADKIVRNAKSPVLVVSGIDEAPQPRQGPVVVGVDGSETAEIGLAAARELAELLGSTLVLVRAYSMPVNTGAEFAYYSPDLLTTFETAAKDYLASIAQPRDKTVLAIGQAATIIEDAAESEQASVVVVTSHGKGFLSRVALGSTTDHLMHSLRCPLLVVPVGHD